MGRRRRFARAASSYLRRLRVEPLEERRMLAALTVTTNLDVVDFNDGVLSLREAIFAANTIAGPDTIEFDFGHDGPETILLSQGELAITDSLTITGAGADLLAIDASESDLTPDQDNGDGSRVFNISDGDSATLIDVTIEGLTITGGDVTGSGGGLLNVEHTTLMDVALESNAATSSGGAIRHEGGSLVVMRSEMLANHSASTGVSGGGGGLSIAGGTGVEIVDSTVAENSSRTGGGIDVFGGSGPISILNSHVDRNWTTGGGAGGIWRNGTTALNLVNSTVDNNTAMGRGGGLEVLGIGSFLLENSSVSGNRANGQSFGIAGGGGIVFNAAPGGVNSLVIRGSRIADNHAVFDGGGINASQTSRLEIEDSEIVGNTAERNGGGIYVVNTELGLRNSIVAENHATGGTVGTGGGVHGAGGANVQLHQTLVRGNTASGGGGGIIIVSGQASLQEASTLLVRDSMVTGNSTAGNGGGIRLDGGTHAVVNSTIANNSAATYGGGMVSGTSSTTSVEMLQVTISGNQAARSGGGIAWSAGGVKLSRSTIAGNVADSDGSGHGVGGGIYDISGVGMFIEQTIVGDNRHFNTADDYYKSFASQLRYSLVESISGSGVSGGVGNSIGVDPKLGPLADNGGATFLDGSRMLTHALLPGSPAIDAGDPTGGAPAFGAVYRAAVLGDVPRYYYRFEEQAFSSAAKEEVSSQSSLAGAYSGSPTLGVAGAIPGSRAIGFDGVNDYVRVSSASVTVGTKLTVELWARSATETWNASGWMARSDVKNMFVINPIQGTKSWSAIVYDASGAMQVVGTFTPEAAVDIREWHHFALTWDQDSGAATMYFDGVAVAANTIVNAAQLSSSIQLLTGYNDGTSVPAYGQGAVDELAVYNHVLPAEVIAAHYRIASLGEFDQRGEPHARFIDGDGISGARIDIGALEAPAGETYALVVDSLVDENDGDYTAGNFSLREALAVAGANPGAATIEFAPALTAGGHKTILLTQGELVISSSMVINGPGAHLLAIDASGNDPTPDSTLSDGIATNDGDGSRVLRIDDGTGALRNVEISGLRLTGGDVNSDGGGILARDNLTLRESIVDANMSSSQGGGIYSGTNSLSSNSLTIVDCVVVDNATGNEGGGIRKVIGDLTVDRTVINGNQAGQVGGGISAANELVEVLIRDSVIKKNRATSSGSFGGGGIFLYDAIATISNSSVVENQAAFGGGIHAFGNSSGTAVVKISNSTVSSNTGGGISTQFPAEISYSTIVNNSVQVSGALSGSSNIYVGAGFSGNGISGFNLYHSSPVGIVAPLFGVGEHVFLDGSRMPMHALLPNSQVIDAGNAALVAGVGGVPEFDQRGAPFGRVVQGRVPGSVRIDIGAYERRADEELSFVVDTLEDDDGDDFSPGDRSLREVIELANMVPGVQTITFHPDLLAAGAGEILLKFGEIAITESLNIDGPGAELLSVNAQQLSRVFNITVTTGNFVIEGLTLANGKTTGVSNLAGPTPHVGSGGAIRSIAAGMLTINDTTIRDSGTTGTNSRGGGVFALGEVALNRSVVSGNSTAGNGAYGGGIATQATVTVTDSTVHGNRVLALDEWGGGIWSLGNATVTRSTISANELAAGTAGLPVVQSGGGGLASQWGIVLVTDSVVRDNVTQGWGAAGGGIRALNGPIVITRSLIADNQAGGSGGGVYGRRDVEVIDSTVSGNSAFGPGGGVYSQEDVVVTSSTVSGNSTTAIDARAGGVGGSQVVVQFSTITDNHTSGIDAHGGGVAATSFTSVRGSIVAGNTAGSGQGDDLWGVGHLFFSLLGSNVGATGSFVAEAPVGSPDARWNLIGGPVNGVIDPLLGPLAKNGGPTRTHALLPGSPAIDAGDPAAVAGVSGVPEFDQRGGPWSRVAGGQIDMGAVEWQANPLVGDYNFNGVVDAADYSVWRDTVGSTNDLRADGSSAMTPGTPDGVVDEHDYAFWKANFGNVHEQGAGSRPAAQVPRQGVLEAGAAGQASGGTLAVNSQRDTETRSQGEGEHVGVAAIARADAVFAIGEDAVVSRGVVRREVDSRATVRRSEVARRDMALLAWVARHETVAAVDDVDTGVELDGDVAEDVGDSIGMLDEVYTALGGGL